MQKYLVINSPIFFSLLAVVLYVFISVPRENQNESEFMIICLIEKKIDYLIVLIMDALHEVSNRKIIFEI